MQHGGDGLDDVLDGAPGADADVTESGGEVVGDGAVAGEALGGFDGVGVGGGGGHGAERRGESSKRRVEARAAEDGGDSGEGAGHWGEVVEALGCLAVGLAWKGLCKDL